MSYGIIRVVALQEVGKIAVRIYYRRRLGSLSVVFQMTLVTVKLLSSTNAELNGVAQYYAGS
jgi:hypothetical protein